MQLILIASVLLAAVATADKVFVETTLGLLEGHTVSLSSGVKVNSFLGFNFAKPPVGPLRFKPPEVPERQSLIVADTLGAACPQGRTGVILLTHPLWDRFSEDCLNMNVYSPNATNTEKLPVFVWFHGGGYGGGANIQYPGHFLAAKGTVVVVPNYRVGALGFMSTKGPNAAATGNYGLMDQRLALQWVQDNIENFGGDKDKVTIFGQSAGASSAGLLTLAPSTKNLFAQAILESGADLNIWAYNEDLQKPWTYTAEVAKKLNCTRPNDQEMMDCLRTIDADVLRQNQGFTCTPGFYCLGFTPVVDGEFIPKDPYEIRESGEAKKCPMIVGQTTEDGSLYTASLVPVANDGPMNMTVWIREMRKLTERFSVAFPNRSEDAVKLQQWYYRNWDEPEDEEANRQKFNEISTDFGWGFTQDYQARIISKDSDIFMFLLGYRSDNSYDTLPAWLGVMHNAELPYVWGYTYLNENPEVQEDQEFFFDIVAWNDLDDKYSDYFQELWINFAKTGNPTPTPVKPPSDQPETNWTGYKETEKNYLYIGKNDINMKKNYRQLSFAYWRHLMPMLANSDSSKGGRNGIPSQQQLVDKMYAEMYENSLKLRSDKSPFKRNPKMKPAMFPHKN
ncbi:DgyrCDS7143 [Dimorphilus gyrociliatus]|uniref:Carboxylic ester hydrolase n=1 Tax=Dimorphilus gyrociliatus TaxID=2664684 RepID=A0A7I8VQD5_9ANNE|nr:DgyrCDS7143 [Dimorphilus gyrociliatus]